MKAKFLMAASLVVIAADVNAQTNVLIYGIADADARVDHTSVGSLRSIGSGGEAGSRWGIRGTEDLGGGIKATFNFEQGIDLSDNSVPQGNVTGTTPNSPVSSTGGRIFGRTAIVGISSDKLGGIRIGRAYSPSYVLWTSIDPLVAGTVGGAQNYAVGNISRFDNGLFYDSPSIYGFQLNTVFRPGESTTSNPATGSTKNGGNGWNATFTYAAGPVIAGYGFMGTKNALDNNTTRSQTLGIAYDLGFVRLGMLAFDTRNATTTRLRSIGFGGNVPLGPFNVFSQVARINNRYSANNSSLKNDDANFVAVGGTYALSRRTDIYTAYAKQINKGNAVNVLTDGGNSGLYVTSGITANVAPGFNPWSAQLGIRHKF